VLRRLLRFACLLALIAFAGFSLMPLLWRLDPRFVALVPAAPQFAAGALLLALCFLVLKRRKSALLAFGIALWNVYAIWPALSGLPSVTPAEAAHPPLKLVAYNLWYRNEDHAATLAYLAQSGADVIGLVEATPELKQALAPLRTLYPHSVDCIAGDPTCEIMLLAKLPLKNAYAGRIEGRYPYIAEGEISWNGRPVTIAMTHLSWPFLLPAAPASDAPPEWPRVPRLMQSIQAKNLARHVNSLPKDLVLMGDFNSASWSAMQLAFRAETGLDSRGRYLPSWPSFVWPILRLPIDHVFTRGRAQVSAARLGPRTGSDHLPVEAEIVFGP